MVCARDPEESARAVAESLNSAAGYAPLPQPFRAIITPSHATAVTAVRLARTVTEFHLFR